MSPNAASLYVGQLFQERYEILDKLGEGGFGTVLKARQIATGQSVALKVLHTEGGGYTREKRIARFQREMRLCAQLHHPNIVRLIDSGQSEGGLLYTVFEFAPGRTLGQVLAQEGRFELREARHLMLQVLDALTCAHALSIVHRDLKPANIMVVPTGARRNALVLDFGIGAITEGAYGEDMAKITATNEALGTPAYSAPEQFRGMPATPRADLYAWGLVFLECITGKRVFSGGSVGEILLQQMSPDPVAMPAELAAHPLGRLLRRATAKDPAVRDVTAESLLRALDGCDLSGLDPSRWGRDAPAGPPELAPTGNAQQMMATVAVARGRGAEPDVSTPGPSSDPSTSRRLVEGERRQLTAVCCSLAVSSAGAEDLDLEEMDELLSAEQRECAEIARRFDGHVAGVLGDQVLIYFGFPAAREDDARRAARAALAIAAHGLARSARLRAQRKLGLDVRVGVHTGLVARELKDAATATVTSLVGLTPKIATRLCASAAPGQILVTTDTQKLLRSQFVLAAAGARALEGVPRPLEVFRLEEERTNLDPTSVAMNMDAAPLVGRDEELGLLRQRWGQARRGAGQRILVTGEPGIGKSRLCLELIRQIRSEAEIVECRCAPESQHSALRPVVEMLERALEIGRDTPAEERTARLEAFLSRHGIDLAEAMPLFGGLLSIAPGRHLPLDLTPQKQKELTLGALVSLFFEMAERKPLLLLIEDLHWADPTTLELLALLLEEVSSARICALLSARPEFSPPWPSSGMLQIQVGRLERVHVEQLVRGISGDKQVPAKVLEQVQSRTDGVPLFVEELTRMILESGSLAEGAPEDAIAARLDLAIPGTLRGLLTARLDRLGAPAKETAQVAAALGREFSLEVLRAVSLRGEDAIKDDLEKLVGADLVHKKRRPRGASYLFKHALIRDTAYESLSKSARREVHARIAKALESQSPEIAETQPELIAHHYAGAAMYSPAVEYALRAGRRAAQRSADREAERHFLDGLRWLDHVAPASSRTRTELELRGHLTAVLQTTRAFAAPEVEQVLERMVPLVAELGDTPELFNIRWKRWAFLQGRARHREALALARENLEVAKSSGVVPNQMIAHLALGGGSLFVMGEDVEALRHLEAARALFDPSWSAAAIASYGQDMGVTLHMQHALVLCSTGAFDAALAAAAQGIALARVANQAHSVQKSLAAQEQHLEWRGDREGVLRVFEELQRMCAQQSVPQWESFGGIIAAWAEAPADPTAPERMRERLRAFQASGATNLSSYWSLLLADACLAHGRLDEAHEHVRAGLAFVESAGERFHEANLRRLRGEIFVASDDFDAAEESLRAALDVARRQGAKLRELRAALSFSDLLVRRGRAAEARALLGPLAASFTEGADLVFLQRARALLATLP